MNQRSKLLNLADSLVNGDRNRQYGDPKSDFNKTAALWEVYLNGTHERHVADDDLGEECPIYIEPHDVAALMILLKLSRITWSPDKEDSWADIAGYAACGWDCVAEADDDSDAESVLAEDDLSEDEYYAMLRDILGVNPFKAPEVRGGYLTGSLFGGTR